MDQRGDYIKMNFDYFEIENDFHKQLERKK